MRRIPRWVAACALGAVAGCLLGAYSFPGNRMIRADLFTNWLGAPVYWIHWVLLGMIIGGLAFYAFGPRGD
jgi:hypothetical protein